MITIKEREEFQKEKKQCWEKLKRIAEEYAQKYMHPHMTIIIDQRGIEELEGAKADRFKLLD